MESHKIDPVSLIFGLLFVGLGAWWWIAEIADLPAGVAAWVGAVALLALGVIGVVTSVVGSRTRPAESPDNSPDT